MPQRTFAMTRTAQAKPGDKWPLDEVFLHIHGKAHYLWRAIDQHGNVLDILVQTRRSARVIVTDKLRSYAIAKHELPSGV